MASSLEPHGSQKQTQSPRLTCCARRGGGDFSGGRRGRFRLRLRPPPRLLWGSQILIPTLAKLPLCPPTSRGWRHGPAQAPRAPGSAYPQPPALWHCGSLARGHFGSAQVSRSNWREEGAPARPTEGSLGTREAGTDTWKKSPGEAPQTVTSLGWAEVELSASGRLIRRASSSLLLP